MNQLRGTKSCRRVFDLSKLLFLILLVCFILLLCFLLTSYREEVSDIKKIAFEGNTSKSSFCTTRFGVKEYECAGLCYCEDDSIERRSGLVWRGKTSVSLLFIAVSSVIALKLSGEYLSTHCEKELSSSCSIESVQSEIIDCQFYSDDVDYLESYAESSADFSRSRAEGCDSFSMEQGNRDSTSLEREGGKIFFVTGATGCIGFEIARLIASENPSNTVYIIARNEKKAEASVRNLRQRTRNPNIFYEIADLSLKGSVKDLRERWGDDEKLDVLVNNHVICPVERTESEDGIEMNMACNVLGYFWLIEEFKDVLHRSSNGNSNSRIVNVVSYWAGGLELDDLEFKKREYSNTDAYFQCKQAGRMLTQHYSEEFKKDGKNIDINSSMSGDVESKCSYDLNCPVPGDPTDAARTPYRVAVGKLGRGMTGEYFRDCRKARKESFENDWESIEKLYDKCKEF